MVTECSEPALGGVTPARKTLPWGVALVMLVLPWLWPYTSGPSPNVLPLMFSWACIFGLMAVVATDTVHRAEWPELVAWSWVVAAVTSSILALGQWFDALPAWSFLVTSPTGRAYANLRQPNQFASLTSLGLIGLLWLVSRGRASWHWGATLLLAAGNAASASRTGLVQWLIISALFAWWPTQRSARVGVCMGALAGYAFSAVLLPVTRSFVLGIETHSALFRMGQDLGCSSRKVLWSNVLELIAQRPWTGWGWGELDYAHYAHLYAGPRFCDILDNAHNLPLHLAVELGIPIAVAFLVAIGVWVCRQRPWSEDDSGRQLAWSALAVIGAHNLVEYPLWYGPFQVAVVASVALLALAHGSPGFGARVAVAGFAGVGQLALALLFWQYDAVSQAYLVASQRRPAFREDPVAAAGRVHVFASELRFAQLSITQLTIPKADEVHQIAGEMLHFSPEPGVIEKRIESAIMLGDEQDALWNATRYRAAFPQEHERWIRR